LSINIDTDTPYIVATNLSAGQDTGAIDGDFFTQYNGGDVVLHGEMEAGLQTYEIGFYWQDYVGYHNQTGMDGEVLDGGKQYRGLDTLKINVHGDTDGDGLINWSVNAPTALAGNTAFDGYYGFILRATDAAGNSLNGAYYGNDPAESYGSGLDA